MNKRRLTGSEMLYQTMPRKMLMRMLLPSLISSLTLSVANVADALTVGNRIGEAGLAAIGLATPVFMFYNLVGMGFATGGSVTHARLTADEKRERALGHFRVLGAELLVTGALIAVLGNIFLGALLTGLGAGPDVPALRELLADYIRPLVTAAPVFFLNYLLYFFVRSDDNPGLASLGFSVSSILDLALNILFVLILRMGVSGAVHATIIAQSVSVAILSFHLFSGKRGILRMKAVLAAKAPAEEVRADRRISLRAGYSSSVSYLFQFGFLLLGNHLLISAGARDSIDGQLAVALFDLVMNVSFVAVSVYQAVGEAMSPLASTFTAEHDRQSLHYLLQLAFAAGLVPGLLLAGAMALLAEPIAVLFGIIPENAPAAAAAIRIFLLSTPLAGFLQILISYDQSTGMVRLAAIGTLMRTAVILLPVTAVMGIFFPRSFWWLFLITEALSFAAMIPLRIAYRKRIEDRETPVIFRTLTNDNRELSGFVEEVERFCEEQKVPPATAMQLQLAVEELCAVTMQQAFTGRPGEYMQVTLAAEEGPRYLLHIRNSAPYFNPLEMKMDKAKQDMTSEIMDSIGVMMVRKKAKSLHFRNYQGYNVMTVEY